MTYPCPTMPTTEVKVYSSGRSKKLCCAHSSLGLGSRNCLNVTRAYIVMMRGTCSSQNARLLLGQVSGSKGCARPNPKQLQFCSKLEAARGNAASADQTR